MATGTAHPALPDLAPDASIGWRCSCFLPAWPDDDVLQEPHMRLAAAPAARCVGRYGGLPLARSEGQQERGAAVAILRAPSASLQPRQPRLDAHGRPFLPSAATLAASAASRTCRRASRTTVSRNLAAPSRIA